MRSSLVDAYHNIAELSEEVRVLRLTLDQKDKEIQNLKLENLQLQECISEFRGMNLLLLLIEEK